MARNKILRLKKSVSKDVFADPQDILELKKTLIKKGYYELPDYGLTPYTDKQLFSSIKKFQKDNGLKTDGVIKPDGETLRALNNIPGVRSPTMRCPTCGAPHGGSKGDLCPDCSVKS